MKKSQAYFSIIQYSEFPERAEFVNIGLVLFSHASPFVSIKLSDNPNRAQRVFGVHLGMHFKNLQLSIENKLSSEFSNGWSEESIGRFISMRSGKVRMSPLRSALVEENIENLIKNLFANFVSDKPSKKRKPLAIKKLRESFQFHQVEKLLEKPDPVELPQSIIIKAPYAYQNGSYNLIHPVSLADEPSQAIGKASTLAVEGEWLKEATATAEQKRLVVVADVEGQDPEFVSHISDMMERHSVRFYDMQEIEPLVSDIRVNISIHN